MQCTLYIFYIPDNPDTSGWSCSSANLHNSNRGKSNRVGNPSSDYVMELNMTNSDTVIISTCNPGTNFDTYLRIYFDRNLNTLLAENDDSNDNICGYYSEITTSLAAGTYYIVVEGFSNEEGDFELSMSCNGCHCADVTGK